MLFQLTPCHWLDHQSIISHITEATVIRIADPKLLKIVECLKADSDASQKEISKLQRSNESLIQIQTDIAMALSVYQELEGETELAKDVKETLNRSTAETDFGYQSFLPTQQGQLL